MRYLLDTNVIAELRKGPRADPRVRAWAADVDPDAVYLSVLTLGEARRGIERLRPRDPASAARLEAWLQGLRRDYADRLLPIDDAVAERWGHTGGPVPTVDGLIAATALVHDLVLVTRNGRDVVGTGVRLVDPFSAPRER